MNKRIRELALQASFLNKDEESIEYFAELIVRECALICNKIYFDRYPDAEDFERSEEGDAIKQHFGVKE